MTWWNDYVGIPYADRGRTRAGADCWGLVRLVMHEQFKIDLPSFDGQYEGSDDVCQIQELIAAHQEGWRQIDRPQPGDVVLFRVMGTVSHIGLVVDGGRFVHARRGHAVAIERLSSGRWHHRVVGFYRYTPGAKLAACPHPLQTRRIDTAIPAGMSLAQIKRWLIENDQAPAGLPHDAVLMLDGRVIPAELLDKTVPLPGQRVEYRAVMRDSGAGRMIGIIAVVVAVAVFQQYYLAPALAGAGFGTIAASGAVSLSAGGLAISAAAGAALTVAGSLLVNSIFPVRPPSVGGNRNPGQAQGFPVLQGGQNAVNPYGSVPVVLGRFRYTPPSAAVPYTESNSTKSYLRMLLLWGYGPLQISDLRIGDTPISTLEEVEYETLTGWGDSTESRARFDRLYGQDVSQKEVNVKLQTGVWIERQLNDECSRISVTLHFPEGLRQMPIEGGNAGKIDPCSFACNVQVRQIDKDTGAPLTGWGEISSVFSGQTVNVQPAWFNTDGDEEMEPVYRWTRLSLNENSVLIVRTGAFTANPSQNPSGTLLLRQQQAAFGVGGAYEALPPYGPSEEPLWDICMYGDSVYTTTDRRGTNVSGMSLTMSAFKATIASGSVVRAESETVRYGAAGQPYYKRKDAFTANVSFDVPLGIHEVRVRRTSTDVKEFNYSSGNKGVRYLDAYFMTLTGYENRRPVVPPKGVSFAMTALRILATNQLNNNIEGISGTVQVICKDWDRTTQAWIVRPTRNPASLIRHVLQHPGNAQRVADDRINLEELVEFHDFCRVNKFMFDMVLGQQNSVHDTLRDIAAAGRASPTQRDGKWTVIIDKPRTAIAQYFTPHNSWGFQGERLFPKVPHAFRVQFNNSEKGYQPDEMIVYNDGYSAANATLFEGLQLPGVTTKDEIFKHARFHLAQIRLRPESYVLNADFEHLICTRGDLVRVTHDVPMWGLGTGRIKNRVSPTVFELTETVPMQAGQSYTVRIRSKDGQSITRTVAAVLADGEYRQITVTASTTEAQVSADDLYMFGALKEESVELIVNAIEPAANMTAQLHLVDYSPAVYDSDTEPIPPFDSQITLPPKLLVSVIRVAPIVTSIVSDESVMYMLAPGQYGYRIGVSVRSPKGLPETATHIEGQISFADGGLPDWSSVLPTPVTAGTVLFDDVQEAETYQMRLRYVDASGRTGPWTITGAHKVAGKVAPPAMVTGLTAEAVGARVRLNWDDSPEVDVIGYEVRTSDAGWGGGGYVFRGDVSTCMVDAPASSGTWYVKAIDAGRKYSEQAVSVAFTADAVPDVGTIAAVFADTSLTNATITLSWPAVAPQFGLETYRVSYGSVTKDVKATSIILPADWIGDRAFKVCVIDALGRVSAGTQTVITKLRPSKPTNVRAQVIDNNVLLYWTLPAQTTLPVDHVHVKEGATWADAREIGSKKGSFTALQELEPGQKKYWLATVDTDGWESDPVSTTVAVSQPPDFIFRGKIESTLAGTLTTAYKGLDGVYLPVDTSETWQTHFTSRSWGSPQSQISAGYPYYIQPTPTPGFYIEVFDFGTIVPSSKATASFNGDIVTGDPVIETTLETSADGTAWSPAANGTETFATNFRYVRFTLKIVQTGDTALYRLNSLSMTLSVKLKNDGGTTACVATDSLGSVANFNVDFLDVSSITLTPAGTAARVAVYDFKDTALSGTYSILDGTVTVNVSAHGLLAGQDVMLNYANRDPERVRILTASANSFTAATPGPNKSGNLQIYPQSMRIYLFDGAGNRASGSVSWAIKGN